MNALRRHSSHLLSILLLCAAVFGNHTAHFAKTASEPFRQTPCRAKVAAIAPVRSVALKTKVRKAERPAPAAVFAAWLDEPLAGSAEASAQSTRRQRVLAGIVVPAQARPFVLRI